MMERELKFFNWLEGDVCTTCAPGDQEKFNLKVGRCLESVSEATGEGGERRLRVVLAELGTRLIAKRLEKP